MLRKQDLKTQRQSQKTEIDEIQKINRENAKRNNYIRDNNSIRFVKKKCRAHKRCDDVLFVWYCENNRIYKNFRKI